MTSKVKRTLKCKLPFTQSRPKYQRQNRRQPQNGDSLRNENNPEEDLKKDKT